MNDVNVWAWWRDALENPKDIGKAPHLQVTTTPEQGFYRAKSKNGAWEPVAIWKQEGVWVALRKGKPVAVDDVWTYACRYPVTTEAYERAVNGHGWADEEPVVKSLIGHNVQATSDLDMIRDQIESAKQGAEAYTEIADDEQAGMAQSLRARMNELANQADKIREAEKRPHLEAGKKVDAAWQPLIKEAKSVADLIKSYIEKFQTAKLRERQRLEAERQRLEREREAEEARILEEVRRAEEQGRPVVLPPEPVPVPPPLPPLEDTKVKGAYGRAASVSTEKVVTGITDQDALYSSLREHPDLRACLLALAQKAVKAGRMVPGVTIEERARVS